MTRSRSFYSPIDRLGLMKRITFFAIVVALSYSVADAATNFIPGVLQEEYWAGKVKGDIAAGTAGTPTFITNLTSFEIPSDIANNYAVRITGYFIPAVTANYSFNISSDDTSDLFLSTDNTPANKRMIAQQPGWNATRLWATDSGGGNDLRQRVSRTWLNASGVAPFASGIHLVAGTRYYIEAQFNEFGGGDNLAVSYQYPVPPATPTVDFPADFDPPNIDSTLIGISFTSPTTFTITNQPQNTTVFAGRTATFTVGVQSDAQVNGNPLSPVYQWRKGGVNLLKATAPTLSYVASPSDNLAQFDCVVSLPPSSGLTNRVTSSAATLTVQAGILVSGKLKQELWLGATSRTDVESGTAGSPNYVSDLSSFHAPVNVVTPGGADFTYTRRVSGFFTPATSGNYVFFVCSDDDSDLFLSTDESPSKKRLIAQEQNWSGDLQWITSGGGSPQPQRRSDQWSPDGGTTMPYSAGIPLVAGTRYYIEGVQREGGGGDDFAATFKLLADVDPVDGDATKVTSGLLSYITSPVTTGTITAQPTNVTVYESQPFSLSVGVQTGSELTPLYQWRKGGVSIAGPLATNSTYNVSYAVVSDSGSYDCVVTIPNFANTLTSSAATVTVQPSTFITGYLKYEYFPGFLRTDVEGGTAGSPSFAGNTIGSDKSGAAAIFETGVSFADNYANRFSGFFVPSETADYVFFVASDDDSDLFLSTDATPANKRMIAQEASWSNSRSWNTTGAGLASQKRSDQWVDASGATPWAAGIHLLAGAHYYLEGVHHEGGGGDDFAATYTVLGTGDPLDGDAPKLTGNVIGVLVPPQTVTITQQPQSVTVPAPNTATFTVAATTTGFYPPSYQWKKGGVNIAGATGASYTTPPLTVADSGSQFLCAVNILGTNPTNSQAATLTVTPDLIPPTLVTARRSFTTDTKLIVVFSEGVTAATANSATNYSINNGAILVSAAVLGADGKTVELTTAPIAKGSSNTLTVNGVRDVAGNQIVPNSQIAVTFQRGAFFVTADPGPLTFAGDIAVNQHLIDRGYYVELAQGSLVPDDGSTAVGKDLIIESSSLGSGTVEIPDPAGGPNLSKFKFLAVPAIEWEASSQDAFGFQAANGTTTASQTAVNIVDANSPLAAGLSAGLHTVVTSPQTFSQGTPVGAHIVATLATDATQAIVYNYDTGEKGFNDFVMPARRIFFFFQDNTAAAANADGWKLFDAAVDWAQNIAVVAQPKFAPPTFSAPGSLRLQWTGSGTLQQTDSLSPPNWQQAPSQANPQTVSATTGTRYFRIAP